MGCDVEFYAFRTAPDINQLSKLEWLPAWRLYKQVDADAWYLEGPSVQEAITFFEPLHFHGAKSPAISKIRSHTKAIQERIKQEGGDVNLFDDYALNLCASLSKGLRQAVIFAGGNDEGFDCFISCDDGELRELKCDIDWDKALVVTADGSIGIERHFPTGSDEAKVTPRMQHQNASEGAAAFFGEDDWLVSSDPYDFDAGNYELVAQLGEATPEPFKLSEALLKQFGTTPRPRELLAVMAPYIDIALSPATVTAVNEQRFEANENAGELLSNMRLWHQDASVLHKHLMGALSALLADLYGYTLALRPKPDFRKNPKGIERKRRELSRRWMAIKFEARILG